MSDWLVGVVGGDLSSVLDEGGWKDGGGGGWRSRLCREGVDGGDGDL